MNTNTDIVPATLDEEKVVLAVLCGALHATLITVTANLTQARCGVAHAAIQLVLKSGFKKNIRSEKKLRACAVDLEFPFFTLGAILAGSKATVLPEVVCIFEDVGSRYQNLEHLASSTLCALRMEEFECEEYLDAVSSNLQTTGKLDQDRVPWWNVRVFA